MFYCLYQLGIHLYALFCLPRVLFNKKKYEGLLRARLGKDVPLIDKAQKKCMWIHAVSLGETKAVSRLIEQLKQNSDVLIILSTITKTGQEEGKKSTADFVIYLPFDFPYLIGPLLKRIKPDLVLIAETDFWYNFQRIAKKLGAKIVLINGKLSHRSLQRYLKIPLAKKLLSTIDYFCLQGSIYEKRFLQLGIPKNKIQVTGNLKVEGFGNFLFEEEKDSFKKRLSLSEENIVLTVGSTHETEEKLVIDCFKQLSKKHPHLKLILAPRHPERFDQVALLLEKEGILFSRYSQSIDPSYPFILVDVMGILRQCYQISDLALVGGSFVPKVGGHNILEPCFYGVPVIFGPYMHSQPDFLELVKAYEAGVQVKEQDLFSTIDTLLSSQQMRQKMGIQGQKLISEAKGSLDSTYKIVNTFLSL